MGLPAQLEREQTEITEERRNGHVTFPVPKIHHETTGHNIGPLKFASKPDLRLRNSEARILWGENIIYHGLDGDSRPEVIERILASRDLVNQRMANISTAEIRRNIVFL